MWCRAVPGAGRSKGFWLVVLTFACAFATLGVSHDPKAFLSMFLVAVGSLIIAIAAPEVDDAETRRSLTLLQSMGLVCCLTVLLTVPI